MGSPTPHLAKQLRSIPGHPEAFAKVFPSERDPVTRTNIEKAIAVFEATLIPPHAPFDRFVEGRAVRSAARRH
jgi:cytochrome c peroxidase